MPRFHITAAIAILCLLAVFLAAGQLLPAGSGVLWAIGNEMRLFIWLVIFGVSLFSVIYLRGPVQAFWLGPLVVLLIKSIRPVREYVPGSLISRELSRTVGSSSSNAGQLGAFIELILALAACLIFGLISVSIYRRSHLD